MRPEAAPIPEGPHRAVSNSHTCACQRVVGGVDVHPHYKLAGLEVVYDFRALQHHGWVCVRVGAPLQGQSCSHNLARAQYPLW